MKYIAAISLLLLTSCSASLQDYRNTTPDFDIKRYFSGSLTAWGLVQDYSGKQVRRFCVEINGHWNNNQGTLEEQFYYHDGEQQQRIWQLTVSPDDQVSGTASDVIGVAKGSSNGNAFNWHYQLQVPLNDSTYTFNMDDWMFQLDKNRLFNRTYMKKLGMTVAEISIFFDKTTSNQGCNPT
ncbi:DUF3833 domain-containing protein [Neptunicella marina]|uniref:DUF3833 domain-containing protein n=1 Tax=Neptunicella marina TaxID=2125989 RepID=A0A8J6IUD0_9ALTE|nr:DUF3833 domain-containing protein [Neptunicella marina]MBC3766846.1 DUF3833 domain-containing protein [Neptunicella marina]